MLLRALATARELVALAGADGYPLPSLARALRVAVLDQRGDGAGAQSAEQLRDSEAGRLFSLLARRGEATLRRRAGPLPQGPVLGREGQCVFLLEDHVLASDVEWDEVLLAREDLCLVAPLKWRLRALGLSESGHAAMSTTQFCLLEFVGRSGRDGRLQSEASAKLGMNSKLIFHHVRALQTLGLLATRSDGLETEAIGIRLWLLRFAPPEEQQSTLWPPDPRFGTDSAESRLAAQWLSDHRALLVHWLEGAPDHLLRVNDLAKMLLAQSAPAAVSARAAERYLVRQGVATVVHGMEGHLARRCLQLRLRGEPSEQQRQQNEPFAQRGGPGDGELATRLISADREELLLSRMKAAELPVSVHASAVVEESGSSGVLFVDVARRLGCRPKGREKLNALLAEFGHRFVYDVAKGRTLYRCYPRRIAVLPGALKAEPAGGEATVSAPGDAHAPATPLAPQAGGAKSRTSSRSHSRDNLQLERRGQLVLELVRSSGGVLRVSLARKALASFADGGGDSERDLDPKVASRVFERLELRGLVRQHWFGLPGRRPRHFLLSPELAPSDRLVRARLEALISRSASAPARASREGPSESPLGTAGVASASLAALAAASSSSASSSAAAVASDDRVVGPEGPSSASALVRLAHLNMDANLRQALIREDVRRSLLCFVKPWMLRAWLFHRFLVQRAAARHDVLVQQPSSSSADTQRPSRRPAPFLSEAPFRVTELVNDLPLLLFLNLVGPPYGLSVEPTEALLSTPVGDAAVAKVLGEDTGAATPTLCSLLFQLQTLGLLVLDAATEAAQQSDGAAPDRLRASSAVTESTSCWLLRAATIDGPPIVLEKPEDVDRLWSLLREKMLRSDQESDAAMQESKDQAQARASQPSVPLPTAGVEAVPSVRVQWEELLGLSLGRAREWRLLIRHRARKVTAALEGRDSLSAATAIDIARELRVDAVAIAACWCARRVAAMRVVAELVHLVDAREAARKPQAPLAAPPHIAPMILRRDAKRSATLAGLGSAPSSSGDDTEPQHKRRRTDAEAAEGPTVLIRQWLAGLMSGAHEHRTFKAFLADRRIAAVSVSRQVRSLVTERRPGGMLRPRLVAAVEEQPFLLAAMQAVRQAAETGARATKKAIAAALAPFSEMQLAVAQQLLADAKILRSKATRRGFSRPAVEGLMFKRDLIEKARVEYDHLTRRVAGSPAAPSSAGLPSSSLSSSSSASSSSSSSASSSSSPAAVAPPPDASDWRPVEDVTGGVAAAALPLLLEGHLELDPFGALRGRPASKPSLLGAAPWRLELIGEAPPTVDGSAMPAASPALRRSVLAKVRASDQNGMTLEDVVGAVDLGALSKEETRLAVRRAIEQLEATGELFRAYGLREPRWVVHGKEAGWAVRVQDPGSPEGKEARWEPLTPWTLLDGRRDDSRFADLCALVVALVWSAPGVEEESLSRRFSTLTPMQLRLILEHLEAGGKLVRRQGAAQPVALLDDELTASARSAASRTYWFPSTAVFFRP